ncbi:MAG TPA: hypothetical protein VII67_01820 [Acidimicrobiales bacterium]
MVIDTPVGGCRAGTVHATLVPPEEHPANDSETTNRVTTATPTARQRLLLKYSATTSFA